MWIWILESVLSPRHPAAAGIILMPVIFIKAADHYTTGAGGMNKEVVGEVYTYMRYALAVYVEENKISFPGIMGVFY